MPRLQISEIEPVFDGKQGLAFTVTLTPDECVEVEVDEILSYRKFQQHLLYLRGRLFRLSEVENVEAGKQHAA